MSLTSVMMGLDNPTIKGSLLRSVKAKRLKKMKEIEMSNDIVYTDNPLQRSSDSKDA